MKRFLRSLQPRISSLDILNFFRQLSTLNSAGLSLMKSLDIMIQTTDKPDFRSLIYKLRLNLESGLEFNHCLRSHPLFFDPFCCQLILIGERTGTLDLSLKRVTVHKEKNQVLRKQLKQALIYPGTVMTAALITTLILLLFVVPQFAVLFEHFPDKIPTATLALIGLATWLRKLAPWLGLLGLLASLALFHLRKSLSLSTKGQALIFHLPYLKNFMLKICLAKFSRNLATTLAAGLPLTEGLRLVSQLSAFDELKRGIQKLQNGVNSGKHLSSCLRLNPLFPPLLTHMTKIGEESGTLDLMFEKIAEIYEAELEQAITSFKLLLEPLIIAILGVLIGGVVIIMYLPIFRLGTAI